MSWRKWIFIVYLLVGFGIRFYNYTAAQYFIYDMGRDASVLRSIAEGDIKLLGPTTGLQGMFLGPLWYYVGLPGYLIGAGNPYVILLWYIFVATLALPLFWKLSHRLFGQTPWAIMAAFLLALIPGSVYGTNFVWNPMLSLPLMAASLLCFLDARTSKVKLYLGFLFLSLTLQSEFAYAIFFVASFLLLFTWLRGRWEWLTFVITLGVIGLTLVPQILFELTHGFSMTKALWGGLNDTSSQASLIEVWQSRPSLFLSFSLNFFERTGKLVFPTLLILIVLLGVAMIRVFKKSTFEWKLVGLCVLLPYGFFLLWRGNNGAFFDYYITPHFIFLVLLIVYGMRELWHHAPHRYLVLQRAIVGLAGVVLTLNSILYVREAIIDATNRAGIQVMEESLQQLFQWSFEDNQRPAVFRIYTPNVYTEHYDYLTWWLVKKHSYPYPTTVQSDGDTTRYILYERSAPEYKPIFFDPWYAQVTDTFQQTRSIMVGDLTLESWQRR